MVLEKLIEYREKLNQILLLKQKKNKKWSIISFLTIFVGILLIIIPAMIVGDNNGQAKPLYFFILVTIGFIVTLLGLTTLIIYIFNRLVISKYKNEKDSLSHEITSLVRNGKETSKKDFSYLEKLIKN